MLHQQRDVLFPFVQGRNTEHDHAEPVIKVFTEITLLNLFLQVFVGGGYHAHIHRNLLIAAYRREFTFLQHPQYFGLGGQRHITNLVQENGAAIGLLEFSFVVPDGRCKGAFLMPEQFAVNEF